MIDKRLFLALTALALLAGCGEEAVEQGDALASEVVEGTISDAMLPLDTVRSEPPLEDPEAFAAAQSTAARQGSVETPDESDGGEAESEPDAIEIDRAPAAELTPQPAD